jgi:hypothetical protein
VKWENILIGKKREKMYEERMRWEGKREKMNKGYEM